MEKRFAVIWFPHLMSDRMQRLKPELKDAPFVLALAERGRRVVKAVNVIARRERIFSGMAVADCKALTPNLQVFDYDEEEQEKILHALAEWCVRYTPFVALDPPDGLILDTSGCTHLWGGEEAYLKDVYTKFKSFGYHTRLAIADTIGAAWAHCHFGNKISIVAPNKQAEAIAALPPEAVRLEAAVIDRLLKLGLKTIGSFMKMPRTALRRRFGHGMLQRLDQALGAEMEMPEPLMPLAPYEERLPSPEPIRTAEGIEIALKTLLETLCLRLTRESKGLRKCELRCYRIDGGIQKIEIGTNRASRNIAHLHKLFEVKIQQIEPGLGIELFLLKADRVEELLGAQDALWAVSSSHESAVAELLDRVAGKTGQDSIHRFLPAEHYWPERSVKTSSSLAEKATMAWRKDLPRPLLLLPNPERIEVSVPIPDYPPLLFKYKGILHEIKKADGPERIEQEWWIQAGLYRDYYCVEDKQGARYWLFRSGDYESGNAEWFIHGFFA